MRRKMPTVSYLCMNIPDASPSIGRTKARFGLREIIMKC